MATMALKEIDYLRVIIDDDEFVRCYLQHQISRDSGKV